MVETLILATLFGFIGGVIGGLLIKNTQPKQLKTKKHTITYFKGKHEDFITVKDNENNEILMCTLKNDTLGTDFIRYAKY